MSVRFLVVDFPVGLSCPCSNPNKKNNPRDEVFTGQVNTVPLVTQVPIGGLGSGIGALNNHLPDQTSVVREQNWRSFSSGEIPAGSPDNEPQALRSSLQTWKSR